MSIQYNIKSNLLGGALLACLLAGGTAPAFAASSLDQPGANIRQVEPHAEAKIERTEQPAVTKDEVRFHLMRVNIEAPELKLEPEVMREFFRTLEGRDVTLGEVQAAAWQLTLYCRRNGYPASIAYLPEQESDDAVLLVKVLPGRYDEITLDNESRLNPKVAERFLAGLRHGDIVRTYDLETALFSLSDKSGAKAVGVMRPGREAGSTSVTVHLEDAKPTNTVLYAENYGSKASGRYRYGLQHTIYNVGGTGAKMNVGGVVSNGGMKNYYVNYEMLVGRGGTTLGFGISRMQYTLGGTLREWGANGTADTLSLYGSRPLYQTDAEKLSVNYGYDYRKLKDDLDALKGLADGKKHSHSLSVGLDGIKRDFTNGLFLDYGLTLTMGTVSADSAYTRRLVEESRSDGRFVKAELNFSAVQRLGWSTDIMLKLSGQKASKNLDSSEEIYLGGANAVRAYPQGAGSGDEGAVGTLELRWHTDAPGLTLSTYLDMGSVNIARDRREGSATLYGWGIGVTYNSPDNWFARLDYARRIGLADIVDKDAESRARIWFMVGKTW